LFATLPRLLLPPLAGVVADRWNRRRVLILTDSLAACTTLAAFLMLTFGHLHACWTASS